MKKNDFRVILVLGCRIGEDGALKPVIKNRIQKAYDLYREGNEKAVFILSGGQGSDEGCTEAKAMEGFLREKKVPDSQIYLEEKSTSTYENFLFSKKLMKINHLKGPVAFVTTKPHLFRSQMYARANGICAVGIGSSARKVSLLKMSIREVPALCVAGLRCMKKR